MNRKDIYEHLAKTYLDASPKRRKKPKEKPKFSRNFLFLSGAFLSGFLIFFLFSFIYRNQTANSQISLVLCSDPVKINFHFDPAKKEAYSLDLKNLNASRYKALGFSVKKSNYNDNIAIRVEFTNIFRERAVVYLKNIPSKWQDFKIKLSEFKEVGDWSEMSNLSFIVEEWNVGDKKGVVYLDNVRLLR